MTENSTDPKAASKSRAWGWLKKILIGVGLLFLFTTILGFLIAPQAPETVPEPLPIVEEKPELPVLTTEELREAARIEAEEAAEESRATLAAEAEKRERAARIAAAQRSWEVRFDKDDFSDTLNVYLTVKSKSPIRGRFGEQFSPTLTIRCVDNTTAMLVSGDGWFLTSIQSYGNVRVRADSREATTWQMRESTSNEALGLWSGAKSIPRIQELFGATNLLMRVTPFNENAVALEFQISGLEKQIEKLRESCGW